MSYHNTPGSPIQSTTNARGETAPDGYHYMPDGTLMSDAEHVKLYSYKVISDFEMDLNDIIEDGENRRFKVLGDNGAIFSLEIKNEDGYYYNFQNGSFQTTKTRLANVTISGKYYAGTFRAPAVGDADKYDIYLTAEENTRHTNYREVRFTDGSIDINSSKGSNSFLLQKVIYQTDPLAITISNYSPTGAITSIALTDDSVSGSRGKTIVKTPFEIKATFSSGAITIDRQPTTSDIIAYVTRTVGAEPVAIQDENEYPYARSVFTDDDINSAVTSGSVVRMNNTDLSAVIAVGDKITTAVMTDNVNCGDCSSSTTITMDSLVATKMAVGDQVTGIAALDNALVTVTEIGTGGDNNAFSLSSAVAIPDETTLTFSSKINRSLTTVTVVETSGTATDFTMSQAIQFRDDATLTFWPRKNYRWPIDNIDKLTSGSIIVADAANGFEGNATLKDYLSETILFENESNEQRITNVSIPALDTLGAQSVITRNGTTYVATTVQSGNIVFSQPALFALAGTSLKIYSYGLAEINTLTGHSVEITDLKVELNTITTTTTAGVAGLAVIPVTSKVGIAADTTQTVNGLTVRSTDVVLDSVAGLGIGQSLYAVSAGTLTGTPTIIAINETTKKVTLSSIQSFADKITLKFANSIISGIGIDPEVVDPYVDSIASLNLTASAAQTIESGQTLTFTGAGSVATITGNIKVNNVGNEAVTLWFDLDKFLTQHTN